MLLQRYERIAIGKQRICTLTQPGEYSQQAHNLSGASWKMRKNLPGKGRRELSQQKKCEVFSCASSARR